MKSIVVGIVLMIAISALAWGVSQTQVTQSSTAYSSKESVRLN